MTSPTRDPLEMLSARIVQTTKPEDARLLAMEIYMQGKIDQYEAFKPMLKQIRDGLKELNPTGESPPPPVS